MATFGGSYKISATVNVSGSGSATYAVPANSYFWGQCSTSGGSLQITLDSATIASATGTQASAGPFVAGPGSTIVATSGSGTAGIHGVLFVNS